MAQQSQTQPTKAKRLALTPEEREKSRRAKELYESRQLKVDLEVQILAEFGRYYGWEAIKAARNNEISYEDMIDLIKGGRLIEDSRVQDLAIAVRTGYSMAKSKKPATVFKRLLKNYIHK